MKKALLASTALVGAALLSAPAYAGTVGSGDNMAVSLKGGFWFQASFLDEDQSAGFGRGYRLNVPEAEIAISASNTADNGIKYGVTVELEVNTDATGNADEIWAFVSGDFGRVELGDQDDASGRMNVGSQNATKGAISTNGGLTHLNSAFHKSVNESFISRGDSAAFTSGDHTKIVYFTPRFSGFQAGASFTPDSGQDGADASEGDNDTDEENMIGLGLNYVGKFDDVGFAASITYETSDNASPSTMEDVEVLGIGARVNFAGFTVGANYNNYNDTKLTKAATAAGGDQGEYWAVAVGYSQGPWGVSAFYTNGERDFNSSVEISVERFAIGGSYAIAPGWKAFLDFEKIEHENKSGTAGNNNDASAVMISQLFTF